MLYWLIFLARSFPRRRMTCSTVSSPGQYRQQSWQIWCALTHWTRKKTRDVLPTIQKAIVLSRNAASYISRIRQRSNPDTNLSSILRKLLQTKYKNQSERFIHVWSIANRVDAFNSLNNLAQKTKPASAMRNKEHGSSQRTRTQPFFFLMKRPSRQAYSVRQDNSSTCKHWT